MRNNKLLAVLLCSLVLCGCMDEGSYFKRWWHGKLPVKLSEAEQKIWDECKQETYHLPRNNDEERKIASEERSSCLKRKGFSKASSK